MPIIHVFTPAGAVDEGTRERISNELIGEVIQAERAPDNEIVRSISWVLWHDVSGWWTGQGSVGEDRPSYLVRVEVPSGSLDQADGQREELVERVTGVLAKWQDDPDRLFRDPAAMVVIDEVRDGNWAGLGRVVRFADLRDLVNAAG